MWRPLASNNRQGCRGNGVEWRCGVTMTWIAVVNFLRDGWTLVIAFALSLDISFELGTFFFFFLSFFLFYFYDFIMSVGM